MVILNPKFFRHFTNPFQLLFKVLRPEFLNAARPSSRYSPISSCLNSALSLSNMSNPTSSHISAPSYLLIDTSNMFALLFLDHTLLSLNNKAFRLCIIMLTCSFGISVNWLAYSNASCNRFSAMGGRTLQCRILRRIWTSYFPIP